MRQIGFTLIELLVVIAIIAILAAIIFPIAIRAKDSAYRSSDISHMNEIRAALQLYRADQGAFPPAILGYATFYSPGNPIPANQLKSYLYPKRITSIDTLKPAYDHAGPSLITAAVWPDQDPAALGAGAQLDLNGDGQITSADDLQCARQAYGPTVQVTTNPNDSSSPALQYYKISGYDVAQVPQADGSVRNEIHYALFWTGWGLGSSACTNGGQNPPGNPEDDPRQLGYNNPPDNTVLTWNSFFRDYVNNVPERGKREIVLFLGGGARAYDSRDVFDRSWRVKP